MKDRFPLFEPGQLGTTSNTFSIPKGEQLTIQTFGLDSGDEVTFDMVYVPTIDPDTCECPPVPAKLPTVAAYAPLTCCGEPLKLTEDSPTVLLDYPQRTLLRANFNFNPASVIWVWAVKTDSAVLKHRVCPCESAS